jgi:hypothetical protein
MPAKLRLVAMAFGQKDTDAIFSALRKTLRPLGVNAQRVDRIEHNDMHYRASVRSSAACAGPR